MAARGWEFGWLRQYSWARPIEIVLAEEKLAARAEIERQQAEIRKKTDEEREQARQNAVKARAQEGQMVQLSRTTSLQAAGLATQLMANARAIAGVAGKKILDGIFTAGDPKQPPLADPLYSPQEMMEFVEQIADLGKVTVALSHEVMEMERLHLGDPSVVIGLEVGGSAIRPDMPMDEVLTRARSAVAAIQRATGGSGLTVLPGGKSNLGAADGEGLPIQPETPAHAPRRKS